MAGPSGGRNSLPWASLLDPLANARALGDIQAQALRAAGDLVERLAAAADESRLSGAPSRERRPDDAASTNGDAAQLVDAWIEMLRRVSTQVAGSAAGGADRERAEIDIGGGGPGAGLRLVVNESGEKPSDDAEVWLHNGTTTGFGPLSLRVGGLWSPGGTLLDATIECDPPCVDELPPRSSRGIVLSVAKDGAGAPLPAGVFRGVLQVDGAPDVWLPIEVVVTGSGS
jgi:hypothetical protein